MFRLGAAILCLALLVLAPRAARADGSAHRDHGQQAKCQAFLSAYLQQRSGSLSAQQDASKMLFFLHVPRTAGKAYYNCFLNSAYPPSRRCAKSYDALRYNISQPGCVLLSSHDDLSIADQLPPGGAVITQLRKPLERVISSYEFAVDTAAQHLPFSDEKDPNANTVSTLSVWPWSQLVPWFRADMRRRLAALNEAAKKDSSSRPKWLSYKDSLNRTYYWSAATNRSVWALPDARAVLDPYNNPLVTPLHEWIELPVARELVHNTAALQILGLTNYSAWPEHALGRECIAEDAASREALGAVALRRLVNMKHVGLTERLDESVASLAATLGFKLKSIAYDFTSRQAFSFEGEGRDLSQPITYNSSYHRANETVPIAEARRRLVAMSARRSKLAEELRVTLPRLIHLLDKETQWVEQQEVAAGGQPRQDQGGKAAALTRRTLMTDPYPPVRKYNEAPQYPAPLRRGSSNGVDSQWAKEIVELDERVAKMQSEVQHLDWDQWAIQVAGGVILEEEATGRAQQILPDDHWIRPLGLGAYYKHCTGDTKAKHTASRSNVFRHLVTPYLESFEFSRQARKQIPQRVLDRILELNSLDQELWELGSKLLEARIAEQRKAGVLEDFPEPPGQPAAQHEQQQQHEQQGQQQAQQSHGSWWKGWLGASGGSSYTSSSGGAGTPTAASAANGSIAEVAVVAGEAEAEGALDDGSDLADAGSDEVDGDEAGGGVYGRDEL